MSSIAILVAIRLWCASRRISSVTSIFFGIISFNSSPAHRRLIEKTLSRKFSPFHANTDLKMRYTKIVEFLDDFFRLKPEGSRDKVQSRTFSRYGNRQDPGANDSRGQLAPPPGVLPSPHRIARRRQ